jgi:hypothetical protein
MIQISSTTQQVWASAIGFADESGISRFEAAEVKKTVLGACRDKKMLQKGSVQARQA